MKLASAIGITALLLILVAALPSAQAPQTPSGREVVAPSAYVSLEPVARGRSFQLAVVLKIRPGFHINARKPSTEYLIPTDLRLNLPPGFKSAGEVSYPQGQLKTFAFSKTPLNIYQDQVILRVPLAAQPNAPLGAQHIPLKLRYQACSNEVCLPPVTLDVDAQLTVAANSANSHPTHPELFPVH
ncbi:MAG TPA: protein-disulfide reductase DsbD N-terminal domain-containing protein [Candidatus Acidoferrum sp.]|nr:protein-disulfide reductase DsbD N-terminal domain-containing protein [Candidatus Acidoferrum sp.]